MKKTMSAMFVVATLTLTSACGGSDGSDRPTQAEIKKAITAKDSVFGTEIPAAQADCVAGVLVDSKVSDKTLQAIIDADKDYKGSKADTNALNDMTTDLAKCVTPATPAPSATATP